MSEDGSVQDLDSESESEGEEAAKGLFGEVRITGEVVVDVARLARSAAQKTARHGGLVALCIAGVGVSSPATGGWGQNPVASSSWDGWARSAALVLLALGLHLALRRTVRREQEISDVEDGDTGGEATVEMARPESPVLVLETYDETYCRVGGRGQPEFVIGQRRWTRQTGLELPSTSDSAGVPLKGPNPEPPI